jgi:hypothetical protein
MNAVARLQRLEQYRTEKAQQKIEDDNQRLAEIKHKKYLLQQKKVLFRKQQDVMMRSLMTAVDRFSKTQVWKAPEGLEFDLDIHEIKQQAEASVMRNSSYESSTSSLRRIPTSGSGAQKAPKSAPVSMPIKKKKAPTSARGRIQGSSPENEPLPLSTGARPSSAQARAPAQRNEVPKEEIEYTPASQVSNRRDVKDSQEENFLASHQYGKDKVRPESTGQSLKMQKRRGKTAPTHSSKTATAWGPKNADEVILYDGNMPRSMTESSRVNSGKLAEDAYGARPAKKVCGHAQTSL